MAKRDQSCLQNLCSSRSHRSSLSTETVGIVLEMRCVVSDSRSIVASTARTCYLTHLAMKYIALLSGGKDSCYNLLHCHKNGHELVAAASLRPEPGKGA